LELGKGYACLAQNRQFQWVHTPWTAYPMVPAYAATMLKQAGYQVFWLDGIWSGWTYKRWETELLKIKPDIIALETKTPVVKMHWNIINRLKDSSINHHPSAIVLFGDHVTALPEESFKNSKVDFVLTGGDYDFLLLNLVKFLDGKDKKLESGIWGRMDSVQKLTRDKSNIFNTGPFQLNHNLNKLPFVDRELTNWKLYAHKNDNYWRLPGTYTMFGRDCWWGRCTFCSWTTLYPGKCFRVMTPKRALDEIGYLLDNYPIKEIMDDSGSFPAGDWLRGFCRGMIGRGYNKKVRISCNMRFNADLTEKDYQLMGKAGFRFILYGLESANQKTLDRLNKNLKVAQIEPVLRWAKSAGLKPHITVMIGYPWETKKDAQETLDFAKEIFTKGLVDSLQATIVIPYPGTPLFKEAKEKGWLKTLKWEEYDMRRPILKTEMTEEEMKMMVKNFYKLVFTPRWFLRKLKEGLSSWENFRYYSWMGLKFFSKIRDFGNDRVKKLTS